MESEWNGRAYYYQALSGSTQLRVAGSGNMLSGLNFDNDIFMTFIFLVEFKKNG